MPPQAFRLRSLTRRQFLTAATAITATVTAGGLLRTSKEEAATVTCPTVTPGSVSGQSGSFAGWASNFVDAYGDRQGAVESPPVASQFQYPVVLSDKPGVGGRYQANQVIKGERWLVVALGAARLDSGPLPFVPAGTTLPVGVNVEHPTGSGNVYHWYLTFVAKSTKNCNANQTTAIGGTVTITYMDIDRVDGSYDLDFGHGDTLAGSFVAPRAAVAGSMDYTGCPTRPATETCLNA